MKQPVIILFFTALFPLLIKGQHLSREDSLRKAWMLEQNDSLKAWKHLAYIEALLADRKQTEALKELGPLQAEIKDHYPKGLQAWVHYYDGIARYYQYDFINSIIANEKLGRLAVQEALPDTFRHITAISLITLGVSYSKINDPENAQLSYQKAIPQLQALNDSTRLVHVYLNLGYLFTKSQDWASAKNVFTKGLSYLNKESNEDFSVPLYASLSTAEAKLGNAEKAGSYLAEAGRLKNNFNNDIANCFYELAAGETAILKKNYAEAITSFRNAIEFGRQWGDSSAVAESLEGLGRAYWYSGDANKAMENLQYSKQVAAANRLIDQQKTIFKTLFDYYKALGYFREAALIADTLLLLNDTLAVVQNNNRRIIMNALFESEQSAKKISSLQEQNEMARLRLKQKNIINIILAGTAISVLLIALLGYRNYRQKQLLQKQRIQELEKEKLLLATDAVIQGQEEERSRIAKDLHDGLGGMLSGIKYSFTNMKESLLLNEDQQLQFERGLDMLDGSIHEMRRVAHNMMPEALLKYGLDAALRDFCTGINRSGVLKVVYQSYGLGELQVSQTVSVTIYRIIQELMNNIIKHAGAAQAVVQVNKEENKLLITVEDDGRGIDTSTSLASNGMGWANIRSRVNYLKAKLDVQGEAGKGTFVNIEIDL